MAQADFVYDMAADAAGLPLAVSIFADADDVRCAMQEDVVAAGFATRECGPWMNCWRAMRGPWVI